GSSRALPCTAGWLASIAPRSPACPISAKRRHRRIPAPAEGTAPSPTSGSSGWIAGIPRAPSSGSSTTTPWRRTSPSPTIPRRRPAAAVAAGAPEIERLRARYLTNVRYVDEQVGRVLDDLGRRQHLERTVVIITSDHGTEFDDTGQGFTGHGTSFSDYQLRTPFVL